MINVCVYNTEDRAIATQVYAPTLPLNGMGYGFFENTVIAFDNFGLGLGIFTEL